MPCVSRDTHMKVARLEPNVAVFHIKALRIVAHQLEIRAKIRERRVFLLLHTIAHLAERHRLLDYHIVLGVLPPARQAHKRLRERVAVRVFCVEELVEDLLPQLCDLLRTRHRRIRACTPPCTLAHLVGLRQTRDVPCRASLGKRGATRLPRGIRRCVSIHHGECARGAGLEPVR